MRNANVALQIDLHRHLDGNIRVSSILELAQLHQIKLPATSEKSLSNIVHIKDKTSDLMAFLQKLDYGVSVLADLDACKRIAFENVQDAIEEGLHHVELRFSPYYMARAFNLPLEGVVEAVVDGVKVANKQYNYNAKLIGILSRTFGTQACMQELNSLLAFKEGIVAVDLAGNEHAFPASLFVEHFEKVKAAGLKITVHAGEAAEENSIWDAIHLLHADRIGHGIAAYKSPRLMAYLAEHNIGLENCLLSNYQTGTWTNIASHPIKQFLDAGISVSLNTDDPGVSNNTLESEYELAKHVVGLSDVELNTLRQNSLQQAFLSRKEKDAVLASL